MHWHYVGSDQKTQYGPIKEADLIRLFQNKTVTPETYVWNGKTVKEWSQISSIEGLQWRFQNAKPVKPIKRFPTDKPTKPGNKPPAMASSTRLVRALSARSLPRATRVRRPSYQMMRKEYEVGDEIKVYDTVNSLEVAIVTQVQENRIKIHYVKWEERWDEWLNFNSNRISHRRLSVSNVRNKEKRHSLSVKRVKRGSVSMSRRSSERSARSSKRRHSFQNSLSAFRDLPLDDYGAFKLDKNTSDSDGADFTEKKVHNDIDNTPRQRVVKDFFSIMRERLQKTLAEGREIDDERLMNDLEKVNIENCRMRAEFDALGIQIASLIDERQRKKHYEEEKESLYFKKKNQLNEFEKMLADRQKNMMLQENEVNIKLEHAKNVKLEKTKLKQLKNEIATLEEKLRSQENLMSKNIGKALAVAQHDPQALQDLQEMKDKIYSERDRLKKDREKLSQGMSQVQKAKSQLLMANQVFEQEKAKSVAEIEKKRAKYDENLAKYEKDKVELQKAQMQLKDEQQKVNQDNRNIAESKGKIKTVLEENLTQFKSELQAARQKLNREQENILAKQKQFDTQQKKLNEKEKRLDENLRNVEQQRKELMESSNANFNEQKLVDQLSRRELELTSQISQLQNQRSELEISSRNTQKKLESERARSSKVEKDLLNERKLLQKELSECKAKLQEMKEELLKERVAKEVWENVNSRVRSERDKLQIEKQKLKDELASKQGKLEILQDKLDELKSRYDEKNNDAEASVLVIDKAQSEMTPTTAPPPPFAKGAPSFENLIFTLMSDRRDLRKQEEEVKKRITQLEEEDKLLNEEVENLVEVDDDLTPPEFFFDGTATESGDTSKDL